MPAVVAQAPGVGQAPGAGAVAPTTWVAIEDVGPHKRGDVLAVQSHCAGGWGNAGCKEGES